MLAAPSPPPLIKKPDTSQHLPASLTGRFFRFQTAPLFRGYLHRVNVGMRRSILRVVGGKEQIFRQRRNSDVPSHDAWRWRHAQASQERRFGLSASLRSPLNQRPPGSELRGTVQKVQKTQRHHAGRSARSTRGRCGLTSSLSSAWTCL